MSALFQFFNKLPFLPRLLVLFFLGILLVAGFKRIGSALQSMDWLFTLTSLLWLIVILGVLHEAGYLGPVSRWPIIGPGLDWLTGRAITGHTPEECRQSAFRVKEDLRGIENVFQQLDTWQAGFQTTQPGVLLILAGPKGTGKSTIARSLGCYLRGYGVLTGDTVQIFDDADAREDIEKLRKSAFAAVDGLLLLDNADWLIKDDDRGRRAGDILRKIAEQYPKRFVVALTGSQDSLRQLLDVPTHRDWLSRFSLPQRIEFPSLSDDTLVEICRSQLKAHRITLEPGTETQEESQRIIRRLIKEARRDQEEATFDNALTAHRVAEQLAKHIGVPMPRDDPQATRMIRIEQLQQAAEAIRG